MSETTPHPKGSKFKDRFRTASGEARASVKLEVLITLWFNTGTLCNLSCENCYIESSPANDRLVYISNEEVTGYLDEIAAHGWPTSEIGLTGGEPFMNPEIIKIIETSLVRGFDVLVLTNAMRPMMKLKSPLLRIQSQFGDKLRMRVSLDHYTQRLHECERGLGTWKPALHGLDWLEQNGFNLQVAGRTRWSEAESTLRNGYAQLFAFRGVSINAYNPAALILFPEMDTNHDVREITQDCWKLLGVEPSSIMCASSRMIVKRKHADRPAVLPCTLLPYDSQFELGETLNEANRLVSLNHPNCAQFCVLGGGSCSVDLEKN